MILQNITLRRNDQLVFQDLSLRLTAHRTGLVGLNGSGKTSLLRMILDENDIESGRIRKRPHLRLGYLPTTGTRNASRQYHLRCHASQ